MKQKLVLVKWLSQTPEYFVYSRLVGAGVGVVGAGVEVVGVVGAAVVVVVVLYGVVGTLACRFFLAPPPLDVGVVGVAGGLAGKEENSLK